MEGKINDYLREADCQDDLSPFLQENSPVTMKVYFHEIYDTQVREVDFHGSQLFGLLWDAAFINCDFSGADMRGFKLRDCITFENCLVDADTIPPMHNGNSVPAFVEVIQNHRNHREVFACLKRTLPEPLAKILHEYSYMKTVHTEFCT
jgi:hypothetical protein